MVLAEQQRETTIRRICVLIHPLCYRGHEAEVVPSSMSQEAFDGYLKVEDEVALRWRRAIANMGRTGALVILPTAPTDAMRDLLEFAEERLGPRCVVLGRGMPWNGAFWDGLDEDFLAHVGEEMKGALLAHRADVTSWDMQVSVAAMAYARDIQQAFRERGLTFDPETVRAEAWGESFEGCVHMYSIRLRAYLSLAGPIEDKFRMTVPDARFLLTARLLETISLSGDVRLYLWEGADGLPIGLFLETSQPLRSARRFVDVQTGALKLQVTDKNGNPVTPTAIEGGIRLPLQETYVFGQPGTAERLRAALMGATVQ